MAVLITGDRRRTVILSETDFLLCDYFIHHRTFVLLATILPKGSNATHQSDGDNQNLPNTPDTFSFLRCTKSSQIIPGWESLLSETIR